MGFGNWVKQAAGGDPGKPFRGAKADAADIGAAETDAAALAADDPAVDTDHPSLIEETGIDDSPPPTQRWLGYIDRTTASSIEGWGLDKQNPGSRASIEVVVSNGKRVLAVAHLFRQDVADAGHGDGQCGFFVDLSKLALKNETAIVRFAESKQLISREPIAFDPEHALLQADMPDAFRSLMLRAGLEVRQAAELIRSSEAVEATR